MQKNTCFRKASAVEFVFIPTGQRPVLNESLPRSFISVQGKIRFDQSIQRGLAPHEAVGRIKSGTLLTAQLCIVSGVAVRCMNKAVNVEMNHRPYRVT